MFPFLPYWPLLILLLTFVHLTLCAYKRMNRPQFSQNNSLKLPMNFLFTFLLLFVLFSSIVAVSSHYLASSVASLANHSRPKRYGYGGYENGQQYHHRHHQRVRVHIHIRDPQQSAGYGYGSGYYNNGAGYGYGYGNSGGSYNSASNGYGGNVAGYGYGNRGYNAAGGYGWGGK